MRKLTTGMVAERLGVSQAAVKKWCRNGRFPNAKLADTPRGPVWEIPESNLKGFQRPPMGRPVTTGDTSEVRAKKKAGSKKR